MKYKKVLNILICMFMMLQLRGQELQPVSARMEKVQVSFRVNDKGIPQYNINFDQRPVINWSQLGFSLDADNDFYKDFEWTGTQKRSVDDNWQPVWGEVKNIRDHYEELTIHLRKKNNSNLLLNIIFRVFADGVGFRYEFPKQSGLKYFIVKNELTQFNLTGDHKTFWIPGDYDTNEYLYTTSSISDIDNTEIVKTSTDIAVRTVRDPYSVQTPLMMKTKEGLYINIHEAGLIGYPAMQLHVDRKNLSLSSSLVPAATGDKAYVHAPFKTPWRTVIVSDKATDILSSKMILNLNEPSVIKNTSWIKPMKFAGVWWEMQTNKGSWSYSDFPDSLSDEGHLIPNGKHSANTANVKRYIDFAAANHIKGLLVEGWNIGWEEWFGTWKEKVFDFTKPYPDFDLKELVRYAASKNIALIMHNETSGSAIDYERQLDTAYRFMNQFGYTAVKTGYVGKIIPRGEYHDGQWMVDHYIRVAQKAADHHVMLDVHEPVRPTGLQRTYPNWLACEAGRGNEYNAFSNGSPPEHETILPFTRLMGGPMDYTPGIFRMKGYTAYAPERQMHSTLCKQLALYITIYSPLQMVADLPENYALHKDAFQFIKDVPVDWDDTKIIEAEPGDYITIARKEKGKNNWYLGAITDENSRNAVIKLNFLDAGKKYEAIIYADAVNADWKDNPEAYNIQHYIVDASTDLNLSLAKGGGVAVSIRPATNEQLKNEKKYP
ncbi:MAG: glycoside hydrolase family 97 protein [Ferruginibacter sp.]